MVATRRPVSQLLSHSQNSSYICRSCRHHLSQPTASLQQHRFVSSAIRSPSEKSQRVPSITVSTLGPRTYRGASQILFVKHEFHTQPAKRAVGDWLNGSRIARSDGNQTTSKAQNPEYVPAETWDGLQYVGSAGHWREMPEQPGDQFMSWLNASPSIATDRSQLVSCLHQALVECLTCTQAGLNPASTHHLDSSQLDQNIMDAITAATITPSSSDQQMQVQFASEAHAKAIVEMLAAVESALNISEAESVIDTDTLDGAAAEVESHKQQLQEQTTQSSYTSRPQYAVQDESFLRNSFDMEDPFIFNVLKRFSQLSGHRIPDPILNTMFSSNKRMSFMIDRIDHLVLRPKPKELAATLMNKPELSHQSNVLIFPRKETPVDKEKEVGRWKIIEKELIERGLPVLGKLKA